MDPLFANALADLNRPYDCWSAFAATALTMLPPAFGQRWPRLVRALARCVRRDLQTLGFELQSLWYVRHQRSAIAAYLDRHEVRCLQVGAGSTPLKGWLNTDLRPQSADIVYMDVTEPLPLPDASLDFVFSEHFLHQLSHAHGAYHLRECFRVLKPGGRVRISTPDLRFLIDMYLASDHTETQAKFIRRSLEQAFPSTGFYNGAFALHHFFKGWDHQFLYDETTLATALRRAGFSRIRRWKVGESDEPMLCNIEQHGRVISHEFNLLESMVLEAENRPQAHEDDVFGASGRSEAAQESVQALRRA